MQCCPVTAALRQNRQEVRRWRTEDVEQNVLDNAALLWERYAEANRRFVEERSEQLKSFANLGALITGFAIVSFLQVHNLIRPCTCVTSLQRAAHLSAEDLHPALPAHMLQVLAHMHTCSHNRVWYARSSPLTWRARRRASTLRSASRWPSW